MIELERVFRQSIAVLFFSLTPLLGCSSSQNETPLTAAQNGMILPGSVRQPPIHLEVVEERSDGEFLYLLVELSTETTWPTEMIHIELETMNDGNPIVTEDFSVADLVASNYQIGGASSKSLSPNSPLKIPLSIGASGATDYQIR
ncbi:MAG: hypothetical protein KDD64_10615, partial [Bdellovibrionales bacterium]|nr:hypothetical protein [Bdellovibrionales bacterium]